MSAKFYKSPAVIFEEQIPLLAKEITGIPQVISAGGACGRPDVGNAVNLKSAPVFVRQSKKMPRFKLLAV